MKKVLVINSSARVQRSQSRKLTDVFVEHWKNMHVDPVIRFRELGNTHVPHINENWIAAAFKPGAARSDEEIEALKISDTYVSEIREADIIVVGSPMYNWSIPSPLKAYIDQIFRVNETWKLDPTNIQYPYVGLLENKTLVLLLSRGSLGYEEGGYNQHMDFQTNYLKMIFNIMGIRNIHVIALNGVSSGVDKIRESIELLHQNVKDLIEAELK